jgi:hypothetical protein
MSRETRVRSPHLAARFLALRVEEQAQREQVPLSKPERKMLLFSEVEEPEAAAELAEQSDQLDDEYEAKISGLLRRVYDRDSQQGQKEGWDDASLRLEVRTITSW